MNAQQTWKEAYRTYRAMPEIQTRAESEIIFETVNTMEDVRYAAALERKVAAQQRRIDTNTMRINGVLRYINDGAEQWQHTHDEETDSCSFCGYDWPCRYELIRRGLLGLDDSDMISCSVPSDKIEIAA